MVIHLTMGIHENEYGINFQRKHTQLIQTDSLCPTLAALLLGPVKKQLQTRQDKNSEIFEV